MIGMKTVSNSDPADRIDAKHGVKLAAAAAMAVTLSNTIQYKCPWLDAQWHGFAIDVASCYTIAIINVRNIKEIVDIAILGILIFIGAYGVGNGAHTVVSEGQKALSAVVPDASAAENFPGPYIIFLDGDFHCLSDNPSFVNRGGQRCFTCRGDEQEQECYEESRIRVVESLDRGPKKKQSPVFWKRR